MLNSPSCNFAAMEKLQFVPLHIRNTEYLIEKFADSIKKFTELWTYEQFSNVISTYEKTFDNLICTYNEGINLQTQKISGPPDHFNGYFGPTYYT